MIEIGKAKRAGLLATNSIRGGANRTTLERITETGSIFWALSDHEWILDGAAVNVSMIGFDNGEEKHRFLDAIPVKTINPDLTSSSDLTSAKVLSENAGLSFQGTAQVGPFEIDEELAKKMLYSSGNPNNRPNSDVIKRSLNGMDIVQKPRNMWTIDFGADMSLADASKYEKPFEYVKKYVKPFRDNVRRKNHREKWWLFGEARPGMRRALSGLSRYIATPWVSKYRIFVWIPIETIPSLVAVIARDDDYFLGVLQSRIHQLWALKQGSSLEDRPRYTPTTTFETFPFPWAPEKEPKDDPRVGAIARAAKELVEQRDRWLNATPTAHSPSGRGASPKSATDLGEVGKGSKRTLTNLYNQRPTWLDLAHKKLDEVVFAAYGWKSDLSDEEILEKLLALNLERANLE